MEDYHINVFYSEADQCYVADIPDLQYCSAFGETPEQALAEVRKAMEAWMERRERGRETGARASIPPRHLPVRLTNRAG